MKIHRQTAERIIEMVADPAIYCRDEAVKRVSPPSQAFQLYCLLITYKIIYVSSTTAKMPRPGAGNVGYVFYYFPTPDIMSLNFKLGIKRYAVGIVYRAIVIFTIVFIEIHGENNFFYAKINTIK